MQKRLFAVLTAALLLTPALAQASPPTSSSKPSASTSSASSAGGMNMAKVNVNTASLAQLEKIPGMSAKLAQAVIASRPYKSERDLVKKVKGIGKKNVKKFEGYLTF